MNYSYIFIDEESVVKNVLVFETDSEDYSEILKIQEELFGCKLAVDIRDGDLSVGPGKINFRGYEYRDPQPFQSWIYDETGGEWVAPLPHPTLYDYDYDNTLSRQGGYEWSDKEENWIPIR